MKNTNKIMSHHLSGNQQKMNQKCTKGLKKLAALSSITLISFLGAHFAQANVATVTIDGASHVLKLFREAGEAFTTALKGVNPSAVVKPGVDEALTAVKASDAMAVAIVSGLKNISSVDSYMSTRMEKNLSLYLQAKNAANDVEAAKYLELVLVDREHAKAKLALNKAANATNSSAAVSTVSVQLLKCGEGAGTSKVDVVEYPSDGLVAKIIGNFYSNDHASNLSVIQKAMGSTAMPRMASYSPAALEAYIITQFTKSSSKEGKALKLIVDRIGGLSAIINPKTGMINDEFSFLRVGYGPLAKALGAEGDLLIKERPDLKGVDFARELLSRIIQKGKASGEFDDNLINHLITNCFKKAA